MEGYIERLSLMLLLLLLLVLPIQSAQDADFTFKIVKQNEQDTIVRCTHSLEEKDHYLKIKQDGRALKSSEKNELEVKVDSPQCGQKNLTMECVFTNGQPQYKYIQLSPKPNISITSKAVDDEIEVQCTVTNVCSKEIEVQIPLSHDYKMGKLVVNRDSENGRAPFTVTATTKITANKHGTFPVECRVQDTRREAEVHFAPQIHDLQPEERKGSNQSSGSQAIGVTPIIISIWLTILMAVA